MDRRLHCFGDSHVWVFQDVVLGSTALSVRGVGGATAFGLANPNSSTNALAVFDAALRDVPPRDDVLFMVGEIDCGFLAWLRAVERATSVVDELAESFRRYGAFLDAVRCRRTGRLVVATVPPPTIEDYTSWHGLDNARRHVTASIAQRTRATRGYNAWLRAWVDDRAADAVLLLDLDPALLDPETGLVRDELRGRDPLDHHLDRPAFTAVVAAALTALGY